MGRTNFLGEFEELILTVVLILNDDAYGNTIVSAIKEHQNREVNLSSVHITLYRLEEKGFLQSDMGGATQARGGRRKRYFRITNAGKALLQEMKDARTSLWELTPQLKFSHE
ncbi:PadR family transcriptional regulator [Marinoscillum pacificum]|uniref:PadR family transcriptional regulator n=1 Tax=Marinoscillum pacificum TaxID=392723 RepID=UPI002158631C|nr:PadR family transcriptional regulator [Marinoscillum pacificum]